MPYNFVADSSLFVKRNCSRLSSSEVHFLSENGHFFEFEFLSPLWGLRDNYVTMFILGSLESVLIELSLLCVTAEALRANIG